jgi:hypothetical protein
VRENQYQRQLIKRLQDRFPDCVILKNDPRHMQGVPDIIILFNNTWAMLEVKMDASSNIQPNQEYYVKLFGRMSYASFINPDIEEAVLDELQRSLGLSREARIS